MRRMSFQYTHNSTQSALVAVSNAVRPRRQLLSKQTNNMDNSDEPEDFLDGKFMFQKNRDGTFNETKVICTLCGKTLSFHRSNTSLQYHLNAMHALVGELKWNAPNHPH